MENIADALKMAGSVLLFIMALSIAVLTFSKTRETIDVVLKYSDRESLTIEGDSRFYYLANANDTRRYVGRETIIPTLYRAFKESYKIIFEFPDDYFLYKDYNSEEGYNIFDLEKLGLSKDSAEQFLNGVLYGFTKNEEKTNFEKSFRVNINTTSLMDYLTKQESNYIIEEKLGTYYMEDIAEVGEDGKIDITGASKTDEVNKKEKRVITYKFIAK